MVSVSRPCRQTPDPGIPYPVPSPWRVTDMPGTTAKLLIYRSFDGLLATASLEEYTTLADNPPLELPGRYVRVVA